MALRALAAGLVCLASLSSYAAAAPSVSVPGRNPEPRDASCNTPSDRSCWTEAFTIHTDYELSTPGGSKDPKKFTLVITEVSNWVGPDGVEKEVAMLVNGMSPGPPITADWGDTVEITVVNKLKTNGTSIHWHGVRQLNSNHEDGVNGITECPIPPGASKTYTFLLTQYGTSWYHSHFAEQLGNGVIGPIQINGPASANYDIDLGTFPIHDWYYKGADDLFATINDPTNLAAGAPPPSDNIFFNGTNINPAGPGGAYARVVLEPGKSHRLRLLNPSVENHFSVSIVGHSMTVIATDLVPVAPTVVTSVFLAIGQRYDVIVDASAAPGHYWINATLSGTGLCGASNNKFPAAIMSYSNAPLPNALPTNPGTAPPDSLCQDRTDWQPVVTRTVPSHMPQPDEAVSISFLNSQAASTVAWLVNDSAIDVIWEKPTLEFVLQNDTSGLPAHENVVPIPDSSAWTYFVINNAFGVPHPAHLHGHDFMILGHSAASANPFAGVPTPFDAATDSGALDFTNPTRRDVTMIPGNGWLVIGFRNDNPGAWLLHCHIAWHVAQGLAVQFLERADQIVSTTGLAASSLEPNCDAWRTYEPTDPFHKSGSGLRL